MILAPYFTAQRVFKSDDGWTFTIEWWSGDVDYLNVPPNGRAQGKTYSTPRQATSAMLMKLEGILRSVTIARPS